MTTTTAKAPAVPAPRRRRRRRRVSFEAKMMSPALALLAALSLFPFVYIIVMSLSSVGLIPGISLHWAGLDNWTRLFSTRRSAPAGSRPSSTSSPPSAWRWHSGS